ncbi:2-oxo acid dehydrogenase subunit E2 (plasmid) [Pseudorhodobacter turbinis]|uniref:Dihydrolipoamide acetyltransferase component of pyruvate dehydrogenase complex n=1 Tax=Pseudorhodobacter turbinis TaxID=2500533 RepID=A0A4P8ELB6_9RHOB|nr:dihydrolipoamide acetyltransferase family protein [Pseudorhodobacter turbinis]QCO57848.1 2-oxo acid dehydrogenase subunit E2 [Pseudorhodobacter turbinis]
MTEQTYKLPDIGEGIAEAEVSDWLVKVGDLIREDDIICEVTTDKATVEIPAAIGGKVVWLGCKAGDILAIGSDLIKIDSDETVATSTPADPAPAPPVSAPAEPAAPAPKAKAEPAAPPPARRPARSDALPIVRNAAGRPLASPAVRGRARELGIDLRQLRGSGKAGRIEHEDLTDFINHGPDLSALKGPTRRMGTEDIRVTGVRRKIAERMAQAKQQVPHFSIIEEVDVEALEELRAKLNARFGADRGRLTILPFLLRALAETVVDHPEINAHYDAKEGVITRFDALHCGIATQTDGGLMVPVVPHAEALNLWATAREIKRLSDAARSRKIGPESLSGSTMTVTSLGKLGALATTPIINQPEVAIVGVNKIDVRPVWDGRTFIPRQMMNLSCSFDHRVVDGWAAAEFVAKLKSLLETPAMLFMELGDD